MRGDGCDGPTEVRQRLGGDPRDRAKITSCSSAGSFVLERRCASVRAPFPGDLPSLRLAPGQNPCAAAQEFIFARSLRVAAEPNRNDAELRIREANIRVKRSDPDGSFPKAVNDGNARGCIPSNRPPME